MPRGDRTGPMGMGPLTGRGAGFCAGSRGPLFGRFFRGGYGRGAGFGGGGRGWRHMFYETGLPGWIRCVLFPAHRRYRCPIALQAFSGRATMFATTRIITTL